MVREFDCTEDDCGDVQQDRTGTGTITSDPTSAPAALTPEPSTITLFSLGIGSTLFSSMRRRVARYKSEK
jgi:hypothetical protein